MTETAGESDDLKFHRWRALRALCAGRQARKGKLGALPGFEESSGVRLGSGCRPGQGPGEPGRRGSLDKASATFRHAEGLDGVVLRCLRRALGSSGAAAVDGGVQADSPGSGRSFEMDLSSGRAAGETSAPEPRRAAVELQIVAHRES